MKKLLPLALLVALTACSEPAPPPSKPVAKPAAPATPPPPVEAKAPEAPKPDPDKELAQRVKQALEVDGKVQVAAIDVTAKEGRVSLWGTAATDSERARAAQIAAKVEGVASVDNQIKVVRGS